MTLRITWTSADKGESLFTRLPKAGAAMETANRPFYDNVAIPLAVIGLVLLAWLFPLGGWDSVQARLPWHEEEPAPYPSSVRVRFLGDCTEVSGASFCGCALNAIEDELSVGEFLVLEQSYALSGVLSAKAIDAVANAGCD